MAQRVAADVVETHLQVDGVGMTPGDRTLLGINRLGPDAANVLPLMDVLEHRRGIGPVRRRQPLYLGVERGAVADAIGVRLARLGRRAQVIAVTHAPQVAARADRHYLISKGALDKGKRVATRVAELAADKRREEIARMLAGAEITAEARAAAERLIKAAG